jgi:sigma-B regulation protein RsbU (phosphoserine phosphatase)
VSQLQAPGVPLGLLAEAEYDTHDFVLQRGDTLLLISDGATDAVDPEGRIYDSERFLDSIRRHGREEAAGLLKNLHSDILEFAGGAELSDDVTLVALQRLK